MPSQSQAPGLAPRSTLRSDLSAWALGLLASAGTPLALETRVDGVVVSFDWSLIFAALAALAYGRRGAWLAAVPGLAIFTPFALWPNNGWALLGSMGALACWLLGQGTAADRHGAVPRWWTHPLTIQLPLGLAYALMVRFIYPALLQANPAPWCSSCLKEMPTSVLAAIGAKSFIMLYLSVITASSILLIPWFRILLALPPRPNGQRNGRVILGAIAAGLALWFATVSLANIYAPGKHARFVIVPELHSHDLMMLMVLFAGTQIAAQALIAALERLHANTSKLAASLAEVGESEERLRRLFDNIADAVLLVDPDTGQVRRANRRARELLGSDNGDEQLRRAMGDLVPIEHATPPLATLLRAHGLRDVALSAHPERSWTAIGPDNAPFRALGSIRLARVEEGVDLLVFTVRDATAQHRMEEELAQARRLEALGHLAGGVAHDFNNMLAAILGSTELLEDELTASHEGKESLSVIRNAAERARDLTRQLLHLARKGDTTPAAVDAHQLVHGAVQLLRRTVGPHIHLHEFLEATDSLVGADSSQLQSALLNLGLNAAQAMPKGGTVSFHSHNEPGDDGVQRIVLEIVDDGQGIAPEHLPHIFEPFFTTKEPGSGTGLGLSAVYSVVTQMGGSVRVESTLHKGTRFTLTMPIVQPSETGEAAGATPSLRPASGTILVVDDEDAVRWVASAILSRLGYTVLEARNGQEAVQLYETRTVEIDVVVLDARMPRMGGAECFRVLRQLNPDARIVMCSGYTPDQEVQELAAEGLRGFVRKPFTAPELRRAIELARQSERRSR